MSASEAVNLDTVSVELVDLVSSVELSPKVEARAWDKWLSRSALQKCIRRGLAGEAVACGRRLMALDPPYLWRSLNIIAIEDIGFGDPDVITYTRAIMANKSVFSMVPPYHALDALITRMCRAPKSRSACEVSIGMDFNPPQIMHDAAKWTAVQLHEKALEGTVRESYAAMTHLANRTPEKVDSNPFATKAGRAEVISAMAHTTTVSPRDRRAATLMFEKPTDTMSFALWALCRNFGEWSEAVKAVEPDVMPTPHWIAGLPSAALDMHTRDGKIALKAFHTSLSKIYGEVKAIHPDQATKALGAAVFIEEGGLVDRRIVSPELTVLKEWQDDTLAVAYGFFSIEHAAMIREIVVAEMPRLESKRVWITQAFEH